jgi:hypothetical protein
MHPTRTPAHRIVSALAALLSAITIGGALSPKPAAAAANSVTVTDHLDDGTPASLRGVINTVNAQGGDWTIELESGDPYRIDLLCTNGNLDDNHGGDLDLINGASVTFVSTTQDLATIEVKCVGERILDHSGAGELHFDRIHLTGGNTANGASGNQFGMLDGQDAERGGAVASDGKVVFADSLVDHNRTGNGGNGVRKLFGSAPGGKGGHAGVAGAVVAEEIVATNTTFADNATGAGGNGGNGAGIGSAGGTAGFGGSATLAAEVITLTDVHVTANALGDGGKGGNGVVAPGGDGGFGGSGAGLLALTVHITDSTFDANTSGAGGDGGKGAGNGGDGGNAGSAGAIAAGTGNLDLSTVNGNFAGQPGHGGTGLVAGLEGLPGRGGGIYSGPGLGIAIAFSTITANSAFEGSNLAQTAASTILGSIVGEALGWGTNCAVGPTSLGHNAFDDASCNTGPTDTVAPLALGPLTFNGGGTPTRMPMPGSALIDSIPAANCLALPFVAAHGYDQRGLPRPASDCEPGSVEVPITSASRFVPLAPARIFDTREAGPAAGYVDAGTTRTVQFAGVAGIPATGVTAVAFNLTIDAAGDAGYVTAWPHGAARPLASSLNVDRPGQTAPNFVVVPLGADGQVDFYAQSGGHLLGDVIGYFELAQVASAGRIMSVQPKRLFDTRQPGSLNGPVPAGGTLTVPVDGVPTGVSAVVINVTATDAADAGYVTVFPGDQPQPLASTLNLDGPGHTAANLTIVPLGADHTIRLYTQAGANLLADVVGWITDDTAQVSTRGLTVPLDPVRVFDTRTGGTPLAPGGSIDVPTAGQVGIPLDATGVLLNVTATEATAAGYITAWPTSLAQPLASTLNLTRAGETRANGAILAIGHGGKISYFSQSGTHLLADAFGYLLPGEMPAI